MADGKIPEALRLAAFHESPYNDSNDVDQSTAAELRRQHALIAELLEALENMLMHIGNGREDSVEWVCEPIHSDEIKAARAVLSKAKESS